MTNTVLPAAYQRIPSRGHRINSTVTNVFLLQNKCQRSHELHRHKRLPTSRQIAVSVPVGEEVMNSTATRLFPRQTILLHRLMHPLVPISPQVHTRQRTGQLPSDSLRCSYFLRGILFSTGRTLRQWPSQPPGFFTSTTQTNCFPQDDPSAHSSSRLPSRPPPRQALPPLFPALLQIPPTRL